MRRLREQPTTTGGFVAFVSTVLAVVLTRAQRVLSLVQFDGVEPGLLTGADRELARTIFGAVEAVPPIARTVPTVVAGARSGKSYVASLRLLHLGLTVPLDSLAPGELAFGLIVSFDLRTARQALRYIAGAIKSVPRLEAMTAHETVDSIRLVREDGRTVVFEAVPAARCGGSLRGRSLFGAILDEVAFQRDADYEVSDVELYRALLPRIVPSGQLIISSTPWGERGLLWELYRDNWGSPKTAIVAHAPTLVMRDDPHTREMAEREYQRDPVNAQREYGARFAGRDDQLLDKRHIERAFRGETNLYDPTIDYALAWDIGLRRDATVIAIGHRELNARQKAPPISTLVVDRLEVLVPDRNQPLELDDVERWIAKLAKEYNVRLSTGDQHLFDAIAPRLRSRGINAVEASMAPGAQAKRGSMLASRFIEGSIVLPSNEIAERQLKDVRIIRHPGGRVSIEAPRGKHDDVPDCLMLLTEIAEQLTEGGNVECQTSGFYADDGVHFTTRWFTRSPDGSVTPCEPPRGTPEWEQARRDRAMRGEFTPEDMRDIESGEYDPARDNISLPVNHW